MITRINFYINGKREFYHIGKEGNGFQGLNQKIQMYALGKMINELILQNISGKGN